MAHFLAFLGVSAVVIAVPGPDTALTIRNALTGGRRAGVLTAVGVACGQATWALFSAAGLAAVLAASQPAFTTVRVAGAAYLILLGLQSLRSAIRGPSDDPERGAGAASAGRPAFRQGLFSNLANPKMAVFFISLLPQFTAGHTEFAPMLGLGIVFAAMTVTWLSAYAAAVARAGNFLRRRRVARAIDAACGTALVALGLRVAHE